MSKRPQKLWTQEEVKILKEKYETATRQELLEIFEGRTWQSIRSKAQSIGLKRSDDASRLSKSLGHRYRKDAWTDEEIDILKQLYPTGGSKAVNEKLPHRNRKAIVIKANELGLRFTKSTWKREVSYEDDGSRRSVIATYIRVE